MHYFVGSPLRRICLVLQFIASLSLTSNEIGTESCRETIRVEQKRFCLPAPPNRGADKVPDLLILMTFSLMNMVMQIDLDNFQLKHTHAI